MAKRGGLRREIINPGTTGQLLVRTGMQREQMAWEGLRYGDPSLPRYATGRVDGRAPALDAGRDFTLRTRSAGGSKPTHPSGKLRQP